MDTVRQSYLKNNAKLKGKKKVSGIERTDLGSLYMFIVPAIIITAIFGYFPMFMNVIAFMDYKIGNGFLGLESPIVGFKWFKTFLGDAAFYKIAFRTFLYSASGIVLGFPASLTLALLFNELRNKTFKKVVQTMAYIPNFVSWVTVSGLVYIFLTVEPEGLLNTIRVSIFNLERISFMQRPEDFLPILLITGIWKSVGWGTILYMAGLSNLDEQVYEAANVDGASRFQKVFYITFPGLIPIFCINLIFSMGGLFSSNFDQVFNLQNSVIRQDVMTINLYTYFNGIINHQYSMSTAVGLFQGFIAFILIYSVNAITRKLADVGIF